MFLPKRVAEIKSFAEYKEPAKKLVLEKLMKINPALKLSNYNNIKNNSWYCYDIKIDKHLEEISELLL